MENIEVMPVSLLKELAASAIYAATATRAEANELRQAYVASLERTIGGFAVSALTWRSAGDIAVGALKDAMDKVQVAREQRADLVGLFCNEWNSKLHDKCPGRRMVSPPEAVGARAMRSSAATLDRPRG